MSQALCGRRGVGLLLVLTAGWVVMAGSSHAEGPWEETGEMTEARSEHAAVRLADGRVLVAGGEGGAPFMHFTRTENVTATAEIYEPDQGSWSVAGPPPGGANPMALLTAPGCDGDDAPEWCGKVLGIGASPDPVTPTGTWLYEPTEDEWSLTEEMPESTYSHEVSLVGLESGQVLLVTDHGSAEIFDPGNESWSQTASPSEGAAGQPITRLSDGRVFLAGNSPEVYDPEADEWEPAGSRDLEYSPQTATLLDGRRCRKHPSLQWCGQVLVTGRYQKATLADLYDPHTDSWRRLDNQPQDHERYNWTATGLADGSVLLAGGSLAERFDPQLRQWAPVGAMNHGRFKHTATRLVDGRVLVAGGEPGRRPSSSRNLWNQTHSAELWGPDANAVVQAPVLDRVEPAWAWVSGGEQVEVSGENLEGVTAVEFGGIASPEIERKSEDKLEVRVPARESPGAVSVVARADDRTSNAAPFTFVAPDAMSSWTGFLDQPRYDMTLTRRAEDGHVIAVGGSTGNQFFQTHPKSVASVAAFDPSAANDFSESGAGASGAWEQIGELNQSRSEHSTTQLDDGRLLVAGGETQYRPGFDPAVRHSSTELSEDGGRSWQPGPDMAVPRSGHAAALLSGRVCDGDDRPAWCGRALVASGKTAEVFDPAEDAFVLTEPPPSGARAPGVFLDGESCGHDDAPEWCNRVLVLGDGSSPQLYRPSDGPTGEGVWTEAAAMSESRGSSYGLARLDDGRVLVIGGDDGLRSAEIYHPNADEWKVLDAELAVGRSDPAVTLLPDGSVIVVGGEEEPGNPTAVAERFVPAEDGRGEFTPFAEINADRTLVEAIWLPDGPWETCEVNCGRLLLAGGRAGGHGRPPTEASELMTVRPQVTDVSPAQGPLSGGTEVTVEGYGLAGVTEVAFGGVAAREVTPDPQQPARRVTAVAPAAAAGEAQVSVTVQAEPDETLTSEGGTAFEYRKPGFAPPGRVEDLSATAQSATEVELSFSAVASDDPSPPPAEDYEVKQAREPIEDEETFEDATALCGGVCEFGPGEIGDELTLTVSDLEPGTTYHYAVKARHAGELGERSDPASVTTPETAMGLVEKLVAEPVGGEAVQLKWEAVADGAGGATEQYAVVQAREPIDKAEDFEAAFALCGGVCTFDPPPQTPGDPVELVVRDLDPETTYHYAVAAVDAGGNRGPVSESVAVTTGERPDVGDDEADGEVGAADAVAEDVVRLAGADRIATAVAASQQTFNAGQAEAAVLARADVFADGLAGVPLAAAHDAPLLLSHTDRLDGRVEAELARAVADDGRVFLLGGTVALDESVAEQVRALRLEPVRLAGANRFQTAATIAEEGLGAPDQVLLATGGDFADAVTAGTAAAQAEGAVVLSAGDELPVATADYLARQEPEEGYAVGGPAAEALPAAAPLVGATRFETAAVVAEALFPQPSTVGVATGLRFPDALSGGAHVAAQGGPMLLSGSETLHRAAADYLASRPESADVGVLYGGPAALTPTVADDLARALGHTS